MTESPDPLESNIGVTAEDVHDLGALLSGMAHKAKCMPNTPEAAEVRGSLGVMTLAVHRLANAVLKFQISRGDV